MRRTVQLDGGVARDQRLVYVFMAGERHSVTGREGRTRAGAGAARPERQPDGSRCIANQSSDMTLDNFPSRGSRQRWHTPTYKSRIRIWARKQNGYHNVVKERQCFA